MKKTTVIFALTPQEAKYAYSYRCSHSKENVKILAFDLPAQNVLRAFGVPFDDYFIGYYSRRDYYTRRIRKYEILSRAIAKRVIQKLLPVFSEFESTLQSLQNRIELSCIEVLDAYYYFKEIEHLWKPTKYLLAKHHTWENKRYGLYAPSASLAILIFRSFVSADKREYFTINNFLSKFSEVFFYGKVFVRSLKTNPIKIILLIDRIAQRLRNTLYGLQIRQCDILFFATGGRNLLYYHRVLSLFPSSTNGRRYAVIFQDLLLDEEMLIKNANIPFARFTTFLKYIDNKFCNVAIYRLTKNVTSFFTKNDPNQWIEGKIERPIKQALHDQMKHTILSNLAKTLTNVLAASRILEMYRPAVLVTTHDPGPSALPLVLDAKRRGIATVVLMHGWQDTLMGVDHKSEIITVWGKHTFAWYKTLLGKDPKSIKPLGYPGFDDLFLDKASFWENREPLSPLCSPTKIGLLLTIYTPNTIGLPIFLDQLFNALSARKSEYVLSIRTHPSQNVDGIKKCAGQHGLNIIINPSVRLETFITTQDIILSWDTTALFWAMIYGKPLYYCSPNWDFGITPINRFGGAWLVKSASDLFNQIDRLRNKKNYKAMMDNLHRGQMNFLKNVVGVIDGTSSQKHATFLADLVQKKRISPVYQADRD